MSDFEKKTVTSPIKVTVTRLEEIFEETNPYPVFQEKIIKDYVYSNEKRIIA
jgi:hypothetical protein